MDNASFFSSWGKGKQNVESYSPSRFCRDGTVASTLIAISLASAASSDIASSVECRTLRCPCRQGWLWVRLNSSVLVVFLGCGFKQERSINVAKLLRAYGGCLGIR